MNTKLFAILICLSGCATQTGGLHLTSTTPVRISQITDGKVEETKSFEANRRFQVEGDAIRVESEGYQPLILVNLDSKVVADSAANPIALNLKPVGEWKAPNTEAYITKELDHLYLDMIEVYQLVRDQKLDSALAKVNLTIKAYPKLSSVYYIKAQIEYLIGDRKNADDSLKLALILKPEFKEALDLRERISGEGRR